MKSLEIIAKDLHEALREGAGPTLIDCREPWENELVCIANSTLVPMNDTPGRIEELRLIEGPFVVYCHHGIRSMQVVRWLRSQGLAEACSLAGGIDAWSLEVDTELPRY
jgi:rhodanese-related sulfurtransferase